MNNASIPLAARFSRRQLARSLAIAIFCGVIFLSLWHARSVASNGGGNALTGNHPNTASNGAGTKLVAVHTDSPQAVDADNSVGCVKCHQNVLDPHKPEVSGNLNITCTDCHGGNGMAATKEAAHPKPRYPEKWKSSANPNESFTLLNNESLEWIRFVNPSDLRAVDLACGKCHQSTNNTVKKSSMSTSAQVYSTGLYNNGSVPSKDALFEENYSPHGQPQAIRTIPPPTPEMTRLKGILAILWPLPRFEIGQPLSVNFLRPFERGGGPKSEVGNPNREDVSGQPDESFSNRGYGTQASVDPVVLGAQKVRLNDPVMFFMGTNNAPGDYRQSGCASCHVIYANDRERFNSGPYAKFGNRGTTAPDNPDPTIPKGESGHPLSHRFTRAIPSSQCITCHVHNGNGFLNTYLGYMWWDEETDGEKLYPKQQYNPTLKELDEAGRFNPEEAAARGLWWKTDFLNDVSGLNPQLKKVQFSDYHGHGWMFRRVYNQDRKGNYLDKDGKPIPFDDPNLFGNNGQPAKAVHLKDIHLEKGMHCVDCHFSNDAHGNGLVYGDRRAAIEIGCVDCHGTIQKAIFPDSKNPPRTSGPAAGQGSRDGKYVAENQGLNLARINAAAPGTKVIERIGRNETRKDADGNEVSLQRGDIIQNSMVEPNLWWRVKQTKDTITEGNRDYNPKSARAKTMLRDNETWGQVPSEGSQLAHSNDRVSCIACHTSWTTNCWGCHLSARVNLKKPMLHNEGDETQVYPSYNPQALRADGYMLGVDGTVTGHKVMPVRSSSAVTFSVQNAQREQVINQVPTISAAGFTGNAFNTHVPHTVRATETKTCSDCHISRANDNNAWMASVLMLGTNEVNYMSRFIYVAEGQSGLSATVVGTDTEPEAVYGSHLQSIAYPDDYAQHMKRQMRLTENYAHRTNESNQVQLYGEFLLSAAGPKGFIVYDVANVANKGFSQRIVTSNFSGIGQNLYVKTKDATGVAVGSPAPLDLRRNGPGMSEDQRKWIAINEEQPIAPLFGYAFISDRVEGLITVDITTLSDGVNTNNHLKRTATYNPAGRLTGARSVEIVGNYAYMLTERGLAIVNISDPVNPKFISEVTEPLHNPRDLKVQFRYCFVTDANGLQVLDVTDLEHPRAVVSAQVPLKNAQRLYLARTYAYVADGTDGLAIVNIERPEQPWLDQLFNAGGQLNDTRDVKVGMVYASLLAYVADGKNGLKVVELTNPNSVPGNLGYSPRPNPRLIAYYPTRGTALQVSEGDRRERGVDESGNQIGVFGRRGARPFNLDEQRRMYLINGKLFTVTDESEEPRTPRAASASSARDSRLKELLSFIGWRAVGGIGQ